MDRCGECGFEYDLSQAEEAGASIVLGSADIGRALSDADAPAVRREAGRWSPVEYGCHVRDVLIVQRERVLSALRTEGPGFDPMGRDERAEHDGYAGQQVDDVARQLGDSAQLLANVLWRLDGRQWERTVVYNYPEKRERSLRWVAVHTVHEVCHHLLDIRRQVEAPS
jgi:hypothetical protein